MSFPFNWAEFGNDAVWRNTTILSYNTTLRDGAKKLKLHNVSFLYANIPFQNYKNHCHWKEAVLDLGTPESYGSVQPPPRKWDGKRHFSLARSLLICNDSGKSKQCRSLTFALENGTDSVCVRLGRIYLSHYCTVRFGAKNYFQQQ